MNRQNAERHVISKSRRADMTVKLILTKKVHDPMNTWTEIKTVDVEILIDMQDGWNVIGAERPDQTE